MLKFSGWSTTKAAPAKKVAKKDDKPAAKKAPVGAKVEAPKKGKK